MRTTIMTDDFWMGHGTPHGDSFISKTHFISKDFGKSGRVAQTDGVFYVIGRYVPIQLMANRFGLQMDGSTKVF